MANPKVLSIILAGGEGKRLMPLTADRAKPAVPFGGSYRMIDFALSNMVNSGFARVAVLTQYKSHSLDRHITVGWRLSAMLGNYVTPVPAQQRRGPHWYQGSADALYQSMNLINDEKPDYIIVFGADNIYRMDVTQMLQAHIDSGKAASVAAIRVPKEQASGFGIIDAGPDSVIKQFLEKPADPPGLADDSSVSLASMGNYIFSCKDLIERLNEDAQDRNSKHDMGGDIIPSFVSGGDCAVYDFNDNDVPGATEQDRNYWRDVGTIDSFLDAHMDLVSVVPEFNLYNSKWPIWTSLEQLPGAKFTLHGTAESSIVTSGDIISGGHVDHSVLSPNVRVDHNSSVDGCVLMHNVRIGQNCVLTNAILDKNTVVSDGCEVGVDHEADRARGFTISPNGITVVPKNTVINPI